MNTTPMYNLSNNDNNRNNNNTNIIVNMDYYNSFNISKDDLKLKERRFEEVKKLDLVHFLVKCCLLGLLKIIKLMITLVSLG